VSRKKKLSDHDILELVKNGRYRVDLDEGIIYSGTTHKPLYIRDGGRNGTYPRVWVWYKQSRRNVSVARMVWLAGSRRAVPEGFEIHHRDKDATHNWWDNLFCLFELDHRKLHNGAKLVDDEEQSETPF
jgi:hypothetical protein